MRVAVVLLAVVLPMQAAAQDASTIAPGARVRVRTSDGRTLIGRVDAITPAGLELQPEGQSVAIALPRLALARVEVSRGPRTRKASAWAGAKKGALIGGIPGGLLGALVGASRPGEHWERVQPIY